MTRLSEAGQGPERPQLKGRAVPSKVLGMVMKLFHMVGGYVMCWHMVLTAAAFHNRDAKKFGTIQTTYDKNRKQSSANKLFINDSLMFHSRRVR